MDERTRQECRKIRNRRTGWKPKSFQPVLEPHAKIQHHDIKVNYIEEDDVTQGVTQDGSQDIPYLSY